MKHLNRLIHIPLCLAGLVLGLASAPAAALDAASDADNAKLQELQRAIQTPAPVKKPRTRAIVFDNQAPAANDTDALAPAQAPAKRPTDCQNLPATVHSQSVDFAIQFSVNSAEISPASVRVLDAIGKILALSPERCVFVEGHTDSSGNADANLALSRDRADSVVIFLIGKSRLDPQRLIPVGKGSSDPLKNLTPRDPANRRVVFKVVTS